MNIQDFFPLGWNGWISLQPKGLSRVFSRPHFKNINSSSLSFLYGPTRTSIHDYWKSMTFTRQTIVGKIRSLLFNMLSRLVITLLPTARFFNFMAAVTICSDFGAQNNKSVTVSIVSPSICHEVMGADDRILVFFMLSFKPTFSLYSFTFIILKANFFP